VAVGVFVSPFLGEYDAVAQRDIEEFCALQRNKFPRITVHDMLDTASATCVVIMRLRLAAPFRSFYRNRRVCPSSFQPPYLTRCSLLNVEDGHLNEIGAWEGGNVCATGLRG